MEIELTLDEYRAKNFSMDYDWVSAFMGGNPTWTLEKLMTTPKWQMQANRYDVYKINFDNGLSHRCVVRKEDSAEVWREVPKANTHGGARPGAGRKRQGEEIRRSTVSFNCTESEKAKLKELAAAAGMSQSQFICQKIFG